MSGTIIVYDKDDSEFVKKDYSLTNEYLSVPLFLISDNTLLCNDKKIASHLSQKLGWKIFEFTYEGAVCNKEEKVTYGPTGGKGTITITFGDVAENHAGMEKIGKLAKEGFTHPELLSIYEDIVELGFKAELHILEPPDDIKKEFKNKNLEASILIIRNGVNSLLKDKQAANKLLLEQSKLDVDKKAFMKGRVVNKKARWNLCFDDESRSADYEEGLGTIVAFDNVPITNKLRDALPIYFGEKAEKLKAEGNYYYDIRNCYIGWHGDTERKIVIGVRLGETMPIHYQWYYRRERIGKMYTFKLNHGDIYIMSEKAAGTDWKKYTIPTLRHSAGLSVIKELNIRQ